MKPKYYIVLLLSSLLVTYTHCDMPGMASTNKSTLRFGHAEAPAGSNSNNSSTKNIDSFSKTIWPVTNTNCIACHGSTQQPLHASSNKSTAYYATIDNKKINTATPEKSRLYLKIKDERHNCWSNCDDNAQDMLEAISEYANLIATDSTDVNEDKFLNHTDEVGPISELSGQSNQLIFNADSFMLQTPFVLKSENGISYFTTGTNSGINFANNNNAGARAFLNFTSLESAQYNVWALVKAPTDADNSFHVKINNTKYYEWHIPQTNGFEWRKLTETPNMTNVLINLVANQPNVLEVRQREDGTSLSKILITEDLNYTPNGEQSVFHEMSFDISKYLNLPTSSVIFYADIRDFDDYTYQVKNLRIKTTTRLRISAPKIIVNGVYNSQHNTYNYVDSIVEIGESNLAEYAMIVLKDDGNDGDMFSWSFDILEKQ